MKSEVCVLVGSSHFPMEAPVGRAYKLYLGLARQDPDRVLDFAACANGRTFSATWACRAQRLVMNSCMLKHATLKMQDEAREEWFANMDARRKKREEIEKNVLEVEAYNKEWWKRD